jgi:hypothetical protein
MNCDAGNLQYECESEAEEHLIYGCLNLHIRDRMMCGEHARLWMYVQNRYKHNCRQCDYTIEDYLSVRIHA